jgi:hypothetical protein
MRSTFSSLHIVTDEGLLSPTAQSYSLGLWLTVPLELEDIFLQSLVT